MFFLSRERCTGRCCLVSIMLITLLCGCSDKVLFQPGTLACNVDDKTSIHESNVMAGKVEIVSLQDSKVLIQDVDKAVAFDTLLYILDKKSSALYLYTLGGRYVTGISNRGHAANVYFSLDDFFIDETVRRSIL